MAEIARSQGIAGFEGCVAVTNHPMMAIFQRSKMRLVTEPAGDNYRLTAYFPEPADAPASLGRR
jgi:hypothetical protein